MRTEREDPSERGHGLVIAGLNHRSAPIEIRERFAMHDEQKREVLGLLCSAPGVREAAVVSTCNRVELIAAGRQASEVRPALHEIFVKISGDAERRVSGSLYHLEDRDAVSHMFRVAAGLDSLVMGEPQILGQVKDAYELARREGSAGSLLHRLFHRAFHVAKMVRTSTRIGHQAVSVCYAAKELAERIFGDLSGASVMLVGAGDTGALATKHLASAGVQTFYIVNKSLARACELAEVHSGVPLTLNGFGTYLPKADIVIGASLLPAGAPPLITAAAAAESARLRLGQPQFYIDLGVPRNFAAEIADLSDTYLYNVDDLEQVVSENRAERMAEAARAEVLIEEEVGRFAKWLERREVESVIRKLQLEVRTAEDAEVKKTLRRIFRARERNDLSTEGSEEVLEQALHDFAQALLSKTLHRPLTALRRSGLHDPTLVAAFRELFGSSDREEDENS